MGNGTGDPSTIAEAASGIPVGVTVEKGESMFRIWEYGTENTRVFLLLSAGKREGLKKEWEKALQNLAQNYHVIVPEFYQENAVEYEKHVKELAQWLQRQKTFYLCSLKTGWKTTRILLNNYHIRPARTVLELQHSSPESLLAQIAL
jgi:hypothetical protein